MIEWNARLMDDWFCDIGSTESIQHTVFYHQFLTAPCHKKLVKYFVTIYNQKVFAFVNEKLDMKYFGNEVGGVFNPGLTYIFAVSFSLSICLIHTYRLVSKTVLSINQFHENWAPSNLKFIPSLFVNFLFLREGRWMKWKSPFLRHIATPFSLEL